MHRNQELFEYLLSNLPNMTEEWYNDIQDDDPASVYGSSNPTVVKELKAQNEDYFTHVIYVFTNPQSYLDGEFKQWNIRIAQDPYHLETPLQNVIREYLRCKEILIKYLKQYFHLHQDTVSLETLFSWYEVVTTAVNNSIYIFIDAYHKNTAIQLNAQNQLINELSSPIIVVRDHIAMLPLVGDIDTARAKVILETTPAQCVEKAVTHLCIDLSGVAIIDTMVAHQLFNLIKTLKLIGVKSSMSGVRPEIAQTAVQLGIDFESIHTSSSLAKALATIE
ncbi:MAG: STAS domain-containing protein [Bacillus sp. (in: firmicutes)]